MVVCAYEKSAADSNHKPLADAHSVLSELFETIKLPMPKAIIDPVENRRLPASYANFYIGNKCVLLPVFGDKNDKKAIETLQSCFSRREIIPIPSRELVYGYGGIHCVTQQEPQGAK
jgi:agmatine deiminase